MDRGVALIFGNYDNRRGFSTLLALWAKMRRDGKMEENEEEKGKRRRC